MRKIVLICFVASGIVSCASKGVKVEEAAKAVAKTALSNMDVRDYKGSVYLQGLEEMSEVAKSNFFKKEIDSYLDKFTSGEIVGRGNFISYFTGGIALAKQVYNGDDTHKAVLERAAADMWANQARNADDLMIPPSEKNIEKNGYFIDCAFAVAPYFLYSGLNFNKQEYIDYAAYNVLKAHEILWDDSTGLLHQARAWRNIPEGQLSEDCWSRGNGWFFLAIVALMRDLPQSHKDYPAIKKIAEEFFTSVLKFQDNNGLWHQEMTDSTSFVEISGTALLLYGLGSAIEEGILPQNAKEQFEKGFQNMFSYIDKDGNVGNVCSGCLAYKNATKADYASHPYFTNDPHAFGPVLLACAQALRLGITKINIALGSVLETQSPACHVRFIEERSGDIAWENDKVAYRIYSQQVKHKVSSGVDFWTKSTSRPILEEWYANDAKGISYHVDHGDGYDFYAVGKSRGIGGTGVWVGEKLYVAEPYSEFEIIKDLKDQVVFTLDYPEYEAGNEIVNESKKIRMIRGTNFYEVTATVKTKSGNDVLLAVGISEFGNAKVLSDKEKGLLSLTEKISDKDGFISGAIFAKPEDIEGFAHYGNDELVLIRVKSGVPAKFYVGSAWEGNPEFNKLEETWNALINKESYLNMVQDYTD